MLILIALWLSRWHTAFLFRMAESAIRGLIVLLPQHEVSGRASPVRLTAGRPEHRHDVPVHAVVKLWYLAPRVTLAIWLADGVLAIFHHVHRPGDVIAQYKAANV